MAIADEKIKSILDLLCYPISLDFKNNSDASADVRENQIISDKEYSESETAFNELIRELIKLGLSNNKFNYSHSDITEFIHNEYSVKKI